MLENVGVNLFAMLTSNFKRFGHNLFIQVKEENQEETFGPFIFIDNDRSKWKRPLTEKGKVPENPAEHPLASFCKFPRNIARRLLLLDSLKGTGVSLGKIVLESVSIYDNIPSGIPFFNETQAAVLDTTADYIVDTIKICMDKYPESEVLIDEYDHYEYDYYESLVNGVAKLEEMEDMPILLPPFDKVLRSLPNPVK